MGRSRLLLALVAAAVGAAALAAPAPATMVVDRAIVCADPALQDEPDVGGSWAVWSDHRNGTWDIYARDLSTGVERAVCTAAGDQTHPRVSGDWVVWQDHRAGSWDIYAFDLGSGTEVPVCTAAHQQVAPRVCDGTVVWQDDRGGDWDVWGASLGAVPSPQPLVAAAGDQTAPDLAPHWLVWVDARDGGRDIWALDRVTPAAVPAAVVTDSSRQDEPAVAGDTVVWRDFRNIAGGYGTDIYARDLAKATTRRLTDATGDQESPDIDGDLVVYSDYHSMASGKTRFGPDVSCYDLTLQATLPVYWGPAAQNKPSVSGLTVVWADWRSVTTRADIRSAGLSSWTATLGLDPAGPWVSDRLVALTLEAQTKNPGATVTQMRIEDVGDPTPAVFVPFAAGVPGWDMTWDGSDGPHTVRVVFRDDSGLPAALSESPPVSRTVIVDTHGPVTRAPHQAREQDDHRAALQFRVEDALSPTASVTLKIKTAGGTVVRSLPIVAAKTGVTQTRWVSCVGLRRGDYRYFVYAVDLAGNRQTAVGSNRLVVR